MRFFISDWNERKSRWRRQPAMKGRKNRLRRKKSWKRNRIETESWLPDRHRAITTTKRSSFCRSTKSSTRRSQSWSNPKQKLPKNGQNLKAKLPTKEAELQMHACATLKFLNVQKIVRQKETLKTICPKNCLRRLSTIIVRQLRVGAASASKFRQNERSWSARLKFTEPSILFLIWNIDTTSTSSSGADSTSGFCCRQGIDHYYQQLFILFILAKLE